MAQSKKHFSSSFLTRSFGGVKAWVWLVFVICAAGIVTGVLLSRRTPAPAGNTAGSAVRAPSSENAPKVMITVKAYGTVTCELYPDIAPETVANFLSLVDSGFYNGLTFHRVISGFMVQGGDPNGNGTGGSGRSVKGEFKANGVENPLSHTRGVLSMARAGDYNSASSQFFIMHADGAYLDGMYAAFGRVLEGMEVVDAICKNTPVTDGNGTVARENQPVIESIIRVE